MPTTAHADINRRASLRRSRRPTRVAPRSPGGPRRGPSETPTGGGYKGHQATTPVGHRAHVATQSARTLAASLGVRPKVGTNVDTATARAAKLTDIKKHVDAALARVEATYAQPGHKAHLTAPYDPNETATIAKRAGATTAEARALSTKTQGESGGNPRAVGHDPGGTTGYGLWQLTTGVGNDQLIARHGGVQGMMNPKKNAAAALELYRSGGLSNWYAPSTAPGHPIKESHPKPPAKDVKLLRKYHVRPTRPGAQPGGIKTNPNAKPVVTKQQLDRFHAIRQAAKKLTKAHVPYVWGGGHGSLTDPVTGLDCSGAVSRVLHAAGVLNTPVTSGNMGSVLKPGPGAVTVYYNSEHTFMKIGNQYWGTSVGDSGAGGLGPHPAPSAAYLADYQTAHVPQLGAAAAKGLGVKIARGSYGTAGGVSSPAAVSAYANATGVSLRTAQKVRKADPQAFRHIVQRALARVRAAYSASSDSTLTRPPATTSHQQSGR